MAAIGQTFSPTSATLPPHRGWLCTASKRLQEAQRLFSGELHEAQTSLIFSWGVGFATLSVCYTTIVDLG
jgi:hypothetical protein